MACPAVQTGERFLATALEHIDCQAQTIGSYGYGALADPGSPVSLALASLLTIFVAIFGIRLLLGYPMAGRDLIGDVLRLGIVLTLATSWPAWRIVGYDLVIDGPGEIARAIGLASQLPGSGGDLLSRLQWVDEALAALNAWGSGRLGVAQGDWFQLGFARSAYLIGTLGPLALVRLLAGILLAIAPLIAGLMLFGVTRSIFVGWAKGLVMTYLASITLALILGVELAVLEPWLQDALAKRAADLQILDAPVEVLVVTLAFTLIAFASLAVVAWIAFHPSALVAAIVPSYREERGGKHASDRFDRPIGIEDASQTRAERVSLAVSESLRREQRLIGTIRSDTAPQSALAIGSTTGVPAERPDTLGASYRRNTRRVSAASQRRDESR